MREVQNFKILQESDYVNKLSDTLAFKVNKIINGMFTINIIQGNFIRILICFINLKLNLYFNNEM